jgi:hypothetical protein
MNGSILRLAGYTIVIAGTLPLAARGNAGSSSEGGQIAGEPLGIEHVSILRETLTIDLRPFERGEPCVVEAVYQLNNDGPEQTLDLLFATGEAVVDRFQVWLNDQGIESAPAQKGKIPKSWRAPETTPDFWGGEGLAYLPGVAPHRTPTSSRSFSVKLSLGRHTLRVRYEAEGSRNYLGSPTVYRQFAYVLAPARSWAGFGGLDVTIHLPSGWRAACSPDLIREEDRLWGSFSELPAEAIAVTVQSPEGWVYRPLYYGTVALFGLALVGGVVVCWWGGRELGRSVIRSEPRPWQTPAIRCLGLGFLWALFIIAAACLVFSAWTLGLPRHQQGGIPPELFSLLILAVITHAVFWIPLGAIFLGFIIAGLSAQAVIAAKKRQLDSEPAPTHATGAKPPEEPAGTA